MEHSLVVRASRHIEHPRRDLDHFHGATTLSHTQHQKGLWYGVPIYRLQLCEILLAISLRAKVVEQVSFPLIRRD